MCYMGGPNNGNYLKQVNIMKREEVYKLINGERDYQDQLTDIRNWTEKERNPAQSVGDFLTLLDVYVQRAQVEYADKAGNISALDVIRKVAGIAVFCMELHGAPERKSSTPPVNPR